MSVLPERSSLSSELQLGRYDVQSALVLIVGWNIAPPPPGPMTLKSPGRESFVPRRNATRTAWTKKEANAYFPLLSLSLFRFLFVRYSLLCQSLCRVLSARRRRYWGKCNSRAAFSK
jgi:hypothetical protein